MPSNAAAIIKTGRLMETCLRRDQPPRTAAYKISSIWNTLGMSGVTKRAAFGCIWTSSGMNTMTVGKTSKNSGIQLSSRRMAASVNLGMGALC